MFNFTGCDSLIMHTGKDFKTPSWIYWRRQNVLLHLSVGVVEIYEEIAVCGNFHHRFF